MKDYYAVEILLVEDNDDDETPAIRGLKKQKLANKLHRVEDAK